MFVEQLGESFTKFHLNHVDAPAPQPMPFRPVLHRFTQPDEGKPHDHPWSFRSYIVKGSYVEEVFELNYDGTARRVSIIYRYAGDVFDVDAKHIHRIVALPDGECWTFVLYGPDAGFQPGEREVKWYEVEHED